MMAKPALYQQSLHELLNYVNSGQLKLMLGGTFSLEEAADVHRLLQGRKNDRKISVSSLIKQLPSLIGMEAVLV